MHNTQKTRQVKTATIFEIIPKDFGINLDTDIFRAVGASVFKLFLVYSKSSGNLENVAALALSRIT